jgi:hypothetical protein
MATAAVTASVMQRRVEIFCQIVPSKSTSSIAETLHQRETHLRDSRFTQRAASIFQPRPVISALKKATPEGVEDVERLVHFNRSMLAVA